MRFNTRERLPVRPPFRLDFTAAALRRLAANVVDVVDGATYYRALADERGTSLVAVVQCGESEIEVRATGRDGARWLPTIARMLGTGADLSAWYRRSERIGWLRPYARRFAGLKPPRYASLWEACAHAIVFQQISIHAAGAIMRRAIEQLGTAVRASTVASIPFPSPECWLAADPGRLRAAGLSLNKIAHLRCVAEAFADRTIDEAALEALPTPQAAQELCRVRGIGPWSAAVILLRGMGRLDIFPLRDSGVARSLSLLAGENVDIDRVLETLGPTRGMLYYHLLLARIAGRNQ